MSLDDLAPSEGDDIRTSRERGYTSRLPMMTDIRIQLAVLAEKMDRLLQDRSTIDEHDERITKLEHHRTRLNAWGVVLGALWTLALTLIGAGVFWK